MPGSAVVAAEDGSPGEASGSILESIATLKKLFTSKHLGDDLGTFEPLFRAQFARIHPHPRLIVRGCR